jgi:hypothetical protein
MAHLQANRIKIGQLDGVERILRALNPYVTSPDMTSSIHAAGHLALVIWFAFSFCGALPLPSKRCVIDVV